MMKVKELIEKLQKLNPDSYVGTGINGISGYVAPIERVCTVRDSNDVQIVALDQAEHSLWAGPANEDLEFMTWLEVV